MGMQFTVDVEIALARPMRADQRRWTRVVLSDECCAHHAELTAIYMASAIHQAPMPTASVIVDWEG